MWLAHLTVFGQTDGYDPSNPPNPSLPEKDTTKYYALTVKSVPEGIGSFNTLGGNYAEGASVYLYAYSQDNCKFVRWIDEEGNMLSTNYSLYYTMPARDAVVKAVYEYNPASPGNPEVPHLTPPRQLNLVAKPAAGGYFNVSGGSVTVNEGDSYSVYAYTNPDFVFLRWENEDGEKVSDNYWYEATMGDKNVTYYAIFDYRPSNPGNPGSNSWDAKEGELIIDDFQSGNAYSAAYDLLDKKGANSDDVLSIVMAGKANNSDASIANNFSNCASLDLTRTSGITTLPYWCYSGNSKLTQIYLPASLQSIESYAFNNCTALNTLVCLAVMPPTVDYDVFAGIPEGLTVYVPEKSIELYEAADGWKDFIILPYKGNVHSLEVTLPDECRDGRYKNMSIELINVKSGQKYKYVVTDRLNYIYSGLLKNTTYNAYLKNLSGSVLAQIDSVEIQDDDVSVAFADIKSVHNVTVQYVQPDGTDCTSSMDIRWTNEAGTHMAMGNMITGQVEGSVVGISATLPQTMALQYVQPSDTTYTVVAEDNNVVVNLAAIPRTVVSGKVIDKTTDLPIPGVIVTFSQTLNGRYSKATLARTNARGEYTAEIFSAPTSVTYSSAEYVSQNISMAEADLAEAEVALEDMMLKPITGAKVMLDISYTLSAVKGGTPEVQQGYEDYNNIAYSIYNVTQQRAISQFSVQFPNIVLLEEVNEEDVISVTASSKKDMFEAVTGEGKVNARNEIPVAINIVERGAINVGYSMTENRGVVTMLYDETGYLVSKNVYDSREVSFTNLKSGRYIVLTMGKSDFFNDINSLAGFAEAGLAEGTDYVKTNVEVKNGLVSVVKHAVVPFFDESKLYYTGDNTNFSSNKSVVVAGNYITLTANIDFKPLYASNISNVKLLVDLPQSMSVVNGSMMVGNDLAVYDVTDGRVSVDLNAADLKRTRFCVVPTEGGSFAPTAFVQFTINGQTKVQPIGSAPVEVKSLSFEVPSSSSTAKFYVSGAAPAKSEIEVFNGQIMVGKTSALANGLWNAECELFEPKSFEKYDLYARAVTPQGVELLTETKSMVYNPYTVRVKNVKMVNVTYNEQVVMFDFERPSYTHKYYTFVPSYPTFTFLADIESDKSVINRVVINVYTSSKTIVRLPAKYDSKLDRWVASADFNSSSLPVNVSVTVDSHDFDPADSDCYFSIIDDIIGNIVVTPTDKENVDEIYDKDGNFVCEIEEKEEEGTLDDAKNKLQADGDEIAAERDSDVVAISKDKDKVVIIIRIDDRRYRTITVRLKTEIHEFSLIQKIYERITGSWKKKVDDIVKCDENAIYHIYDEGYYNIERYSYLAITEIIVKKYYEYLINNRLENSYFEQIRTTITYYFEHLTLEKVKTGTTYVKEYFDCSPDPDPDPVIDGDSKYSIDPSGYVYEAVESNRLPGVTASVYYKEYVEDIYGDLKENIVLWNAEEYAQENPLFTDENGMYQWDVPNGLWQVKLELEGYQTAYSEWLPVPPPQLDINIGMVQNSQPEVKAAKAYDKEVTFEFDKYMKPELLTADNISLKLKTGETETLCSDLTVELTDLEAVSEDDPTQYASKVSVKTTADLGRANEVYLIVSSRVQSYAGITMAGDFAQRLDVEKRVSSIEVSDNINVGYDQSQSVLIGALPAEASKGKTLVIKPVSSMIASVSADGSTTNEAGQTLVTLDENGQATINVNGELLGTTALTFSVADADVTKQTVVNVMDPAKLAQVKEPVASRVSGSTVYRGQTVTLSCETEGASLYYTLDGSDPTDEALRIKYDGRPIAIYDAMNIKVQAVGANGSKSEVKEFSYTIKQTSMNIALAEGWNWTSHNQASDLEASQLQTEAINRVVSFNAEMVKDPVLGYVGDITSVKAEEAVKVEAAAETSVLLSGEMFNPTARAVNLVEGWNWIGYPLDQTMAVGEALSLLDAEEGDRISTLGAFAEYSDGEWTGNLTTMAPGKGYMYKSASAKDFTYNNTFVSNAKAIYAERLQTAVNPWTVNMHAYPNMMCITADLFEGDNKAEADKYFIAAFSGDECRGVGQYVKGIIFLSVYGDKTVPLTFMAADSETGEVYTIKETCDFNADVLGSVKAPFAFHLGGATDIDQIAVDGANAKGVTNILGQQLRRINAQGFYVIDGKKIFINKKNINVYDK